MIHKLLIHICIEYSIHTYLSLTDEYKFDHSYNLLDKGSIDDHHKRSYVSRLHKRDNLSERFIMIDHNNGATSD